jgi:hypothetical protein
MISKKSFLLKFRGGRGVFNANLLWIPIRPNCTAGK